MIAQRIPRSAGEELKLKKMEAAELDTSELLEMLRKKVHQISWVMYCIVRMLTKLDGAASPKSVIVVP